MLDHTLPSLEITAVTFHSIVINLVWIKGQKDHSLLSYQFALNIVLYYFFLKDPEPNWDDEKNILSKMTLLGYVGIADAVRGGVSQHQKNAGSNIF